MLGSSIGIRHPRLHRRRSIARTAVMHPLLKSAGEDDVVKEKEEQQPAGFTRQIFFNAPCYYFFHARGGCTRPDCHFMHDEDQLPTYKSRPLAGKLVDAKVYVRNIPPLMTRQDIVDIVEPCGYIKRIVLLQSKQKSGRMAAIIHMTSEAQTDLAVKTLNEHIDYTGENLWAEKQSVVPIKQDEPTPTSPIESPITVMTACIPCAIPTHKNTWDVLATYDDDESVNDMSDDGDDPDDPDLVDICKNVSKNFSLKACHMPCLVASEKIAQPDRGVWNNAARTATMMKTL